MAERRDIVQAWIDAEPLVDWVRPEGGVVGFPRLNVGSDFDLDRFYARLLERHGTYVGPGHWFDMPKRFFRVGFGWPTAEQLQGRSRCHFGGAAGVTGAPLANRATVTSGGAHRR